MKRKIVKKLESIEEITKEELDIIVNGLNKNKKYGLVWEVHPEDVDLELKDGTFNIEEIEDKKINNIADGRDNLILEGDNLHSLMLMKEAGIKVDVIYIDPPYNRGKNDFRYNDEYIDENDGYKHSKWISFMDKRLQLAKSILAEDGLLYVNIDDREVAELKLLLDGIMGAENFIINLPRQTKKSGKTTGSFSRNHDYILVYTNYKKNIFVMEDFVSDSYDREDDHVEERGKYRLNQTLDYDSLQYSKSMDYPLDYKEKTYYPGGDYDVYIERQKGNHRNYDWTWRWSKDMFEFGLENDFVVLNENTGRIYTKTYANAIIEKKESFKEGEEKYYIDYIKKTKPYSSLEFTENKYSNDRAKKDLAVYGLKDEFEFSKPVELIKRLVKSHYNKNATVLDFFAGSGTTGEATMSLNKEDGGERRFILATNNENDICEKVTYERNKRVITGKWDNQEVEALPNNLTYYKIKIINKDKINFENKKILDSSNSLFMLQMKDELEIENDNVDYAILTNNKKKVLFIKNEIISDEVRNLKLQEFNEIYTPIVLNRDNFFKNIEKTEVIYY